MTELQIRLSICNLIHQCSLDKSIPVLFTIQLCDRENSAKYVGWTFYFNFTWSCGVLQNVQYVSLAGIRAHWWRGDVFCMHKVIEKVVLLPFSYTSLYIRWDALALCWETSQSRIANVWKCAKGTIYVVCEEWCGVSYDDVINCIGILNTEVDERFFCECATK